MNPWLSQTSRWISVSPNHPKQGRFCLDHVVSYGVDYDDRDEEVVLIQLASGDTIWTEWSLDQFEDLVFRSQGNK